MPSRGAGWAGDWQRPRLGAVPSLIAALADGAWLLLVDEAEVVADTLGPLAMLVLEGNSDAQIVVSSRRPLDVPGELVWPVEPLDYSTPDGGDPREAAAVRLLVQRLADRVVQVDDDDETTEMLVDVAARVDGLALELVAGQASGRSLAELVEVVRTPSTFPRKAPGGLGSDHCEGPSQRASIGWTPSSAGCSGGWACSPAA